MDPEKYLKVLDFYIIHNPSMKDVKPITDKFYDIKAYWGVDCWKKEVGLKKNWLIHSMLINIAYENLIV